MESIVTTPSEHPQTELSALELLQAENASMRAELQALRESQNQQQQPPHSDTAGTFNLFGLPREIHDAIYELCVVPGIVFIKRPGVARVPRSDMRYQRKPSGPKTASNLFLVSQKLRLEALGIFLSKNQFIVTGPCDMNLMYWDPVLAGGENLEEHIHHRRDSFINRHLRSISMSLNSIESAPRAIMDTYGGIHTAKHRAYSEWDYDGTNDAPDSHRNIADFLRKRFVHDLYLLFIRPGQLRRVEINLEATACGGGCHHLVGNVFRLFRDEKSKCIARRSHVALLESVSFIGLMNEEEVQSVRQAFEDSMSKKFTYHVYELPKRYPVDPGVDLDDQGTSDRMEQWPCIRDPGAKVTSQHDR
jgi:hypothetical protein